MALPGINPPTISVFTVACAAFAHPTAFVTVPEQMPLTIGVASQPLREHPFTQRQSMAGARVPPPVVIRAFLRD